jgi:hypothetical protein
MLAVGGTGVFADEAADDDHRGEALRMAVRKVPGAIAAHGIPGQVYARAIGVKLGLGALEFRKRNAFAKIVEAGDLGRNLRKQSNRVEALRAAPNRHGQADIRLRHAVAAALADAVQRKNQRQRPSRAIRPRHVHLVAVFDTVERDAAIEKPGIARARHGRAGADEHAGSADKGARRSHASEGHDMTQPVMSMMARCS